MILPAMIRRPSPETEAVSAGTLLVSLATVVHFARLNLLLSHYDARAHLVVARRIIDNLSPCWEQIGAVWLPLPHLVNALPVHVDAWYRTGASAIAISVVSFVAIVCAVFHIARRLTDSREAGFAAAALTALNPNLLYLQSTPMTEPLCLAFVLSAAAAAIDAARRPCMRGSVTVGLLLAASCLTRYEAWPIAAAVALLIAVDIPPREALPVAALPLAAVAAFLLQSKLSTDAWLVTGGFFVPENDATGMWRTAAFEVWGGALAMTGTVAIVVAAAGAALTLIRSFSRARDRRSNALALALIAAAALPIYAFYQGHPFRVRYMTMLIPAVAVFAVVPLAFFGRAKAIALAVLIAVIVLGNPPWWSAAPMVKEAQWDVNASRGRQPVSDYLGRQYDGQLIMASMGSLGHYMQELSRQSKPGRDRGFRGFYVRDFLHEGNGDIWTAALDDPAPHAGWVLIDEYSKGGDTLAAIARVRPSFLAGYVRVAGSAGLALYRRRDR